MKTPRIITQKEFDALWSTRRLAPAGWYSAAGECVRLRVGGQIWRVVPLPMTLEPVTDSLHPEGL